MAVGALALLGCVAAVALPRDQGPPPPERDASPLTWADGSVIHDGPRTIDVGRTVGRYVQTSVGFVFTGYDGTVWSWTHGSATRVGHTPGPLFTGANGPRAGWVQQRSPNGPIAFETLDQATGRTQRLAGRAPPVLIVAPGEFADASFVGLDRSGAWWRDGRQYLTTTFDGSPPRRVGLPPDTFLLAASATVRVEARSSTRDVTAVRRGRTVPLRTENGDVALLSPDSRRLAWGTSEGRATALVDDTVTGGEVRLEPNAWSALVTQWLGATTVAVLVAEHEGDHYRLDSCSVVTTRCAIAVPDLGSGPRTGPGNGLQIAVPTGDYWFPYPHG